MTSITIKSFLCFVTIFLFQLASAQDEGFIYGTITTEDGDEYTGPIRWGKEEVYWTDLFNASKEENENLELLSDEDMEELEERDNDSFEISTSFLKISWNGNDSDFTHQFVTAFGNIQKIEPKFSSEVRLYLKDGTKMTLDGSGYNDVGSDINIIDGEFGIIKLDWDNIDEIVFKPTPKKLEEKFGTPLYGTVDCDFGKFTGYVQWDHDERVGSDILDGEDGDNDYDIKFEKIQSIERVGFSRSNITLKSGKSVKLEGTNDVDDSNAGIIVTVDGLGRVDIEWDEFNEVVFEEVNESGPAYEDFTGPNMITGTAETRGGESFSGEVIFDLDEAYTFEILNGKSEDIKFFIPFSNIKSIAPKGPDESSITLTSGKEIILEEEQDVTKKNEGLLIKNGSKVKYLSWRKVKKLTLD